MSVTSSYTLLLKPNWSIVTEKHYQSQAMADMGTNISIRIDKHNGRTAHNSAINT